MTKNKFIVIEGLEGAGKTNACLYIKKILNEYNINNIILVRQPGSTKISEKIRLLIKNHFYPEILTNEAELLLIYAARIQLVKTVIQPALKRGMWVISDRHDLSSLAYQGGGLGIPKKKIIQLKNLFLNNFNPDLTIYLDVFPTIGLKRAFQRNQLDRIESKSLKFFYRTRYSYLKNIQRNTKSIQINANHSIDTVTKNIKIQILKWLKKQVI